MSLDGVEGLSLAQQLPRGRFIAVLQTIDSFERELLRLSLRLCGRELGRRGCRLRGGVSAGAAAGAAGGVAGGGAAHPARSAAIATIAAAHDSIALARTLSMCVLPIIGP